MSTPLYSEPRIVQYVRGGALKALQRPQQTLTMPVARVAPLGPEYSRYFFHPARFGVQFAPAEFLSKLKEIHPRLTACWHPLLERWQVWLFSPDEVKTPAMRGWKLVLTVQDADGGYRPLDERTLGILWNRSGRRLGSMKAYWDRMEAEFWRDYERVTNRRNQDRDDRASDYYDFCQIKISMAGKSAGNKFANHQS
jgi:hypothetical protein